ncbi:dehalogenase [Labilibaculum antarcticum]|uniref:Dehalogenase n=1 Tax=Labilibaculum antarcticum TaxID=1717717 RepID=A0A1Y1CI13_9BACT|nr:dehalogenase [Labilibaculum antarcticum]BAX79965.1 hypothetical protein ALGA_1589 [Labilibaculum antarcticum]
MKLISWIWFWYVLVGFLMGGGAVMIWHILKNANLKLVWYEWILVILSFVTFMFMSQTFIASFQEFEPQAAWLSVVFMGMPILIMAVVVFRSLTKRAAKNKKINL